MKTDLAKLGETFDLTPTGLKVSQDTLRELAATEFEFVVTAERFRLHFEETLQTIKDLNQRKRAVGELGLKAVGLETSVEDYTIDEDTGEVFACKRRVR